MAVPFVRFFFVFLFLSGTNFCTGDFAPPKPEFGLNKFWTPEFRTRILGSNFLGLFFPGKEAP